MANSAPTPKRPSFLFPALFPTAIFLGAFLFVSGPHYETGDSGSRWVLITDNAELPKLPAVAGSISGWDDTAPIEWIDDFVSLWHVVKF